MILWRLRGIAGWPFTLLFAAVQTAILWQVAGSWSLLFGLWIVAGEPTGWKPKLVWDRGDWFGAAKYGFRIGGLGAIAVPLSTWLHRRFGEPDIKSLQNPREFNAWFWSSRKQWLNWTGAWNEVYFDVIFTCLTIGVAACPQKTISIFGNFFGHF